ncbi:MAG: AAA family ATPase [archaeon]|nr:AAA family ATPase [archaeon]
MKQTYKNSTPLMQLAGYPVGMHDMARACLLGRLNLGLWGDTGSGKTQLARDMMAHFGDKATFILGRNDMDTRELFQQINLEKLRTAKSSADVKELTDKIDYHLIVVDELPNCVPAVRAQLFNLFDGFVEINGRAYPIGKGYSMGIATGNIGQKFTESSNDLGRALKDRMHVIVDTDYFAPSASDALEILAGDTNPRVNFDTDGTDSSEDIIKRHNTLVQKEIPFEKLVLAGYLTHGLDYCMIGGKAGAKGAVQGGTVSSKRKLKDSWPAVITNHAQGSDEALVFPLSTRAAKSTLRLSQALDSVVEEKAGKNVEVDPIESMLNAYKFVGAYSGILSEAAVDAVYSGDKYKALEAVAQLARTQYAQQEVNIRDGLDMALSKKLDEKILNRFTGRWGFMKDVLVHLTQGDNPHGN